MQIQPYLFFEGRCDEAVSFYRDKLGAEVGMLMRFKEAPPGFECKPVDAEKVMHAEVRLGDSVLLMSDGRGMGQARFEGMSLSLTVADEAEAERVFSALSEGGQVQMPLTQTFFSPRFGMVADKFGVPWMVYVTPKGKQ